MNPLAHSRPSSDIQAMAMKLAPVLSGLLLGACSVVGIRDGTEQPQYEVVGHAGGAEIRRYGPRIAAQTTVQAGEIDARSQGFRRLAAYIFGANTTRSSIAMTAPVAQSVAGARIAMTAPVAQGAGEDGGWTIQFFMPAAATMETLPIPTDPAITLVTVPAKTIAALRFSGSTASDAVAARQAELARLLVGTDWQTHGAPLAWFYDPPWTLPFMRRNEVAVAVEAAPAGAADAIACPRSARAPRPRTALG